MRKRGSRGLDWERLDVQYKVAWRSQKLYEGLTHSQRKRGRFQIMLDTLEKGKSRLGRISRLSWSNPDADHFPPAVTGAEISDHLTTLNRGEFLSRILSRDLELAGGPLETQSPVGHKKAKGKAKRKGKKLASVREKRNKLGHAKRTRNHRGVSRSKQAASGLRHGKKKR